MKLKTKLIATISAFCLVCVMLVVGVWALKNTSFDIGGKISFTATGVKATVSTAVLSNGTHKTPSDESTKMQTFSIDVNDTQDHINQESEDWRNLDLLFNEDGEDVKITFSVTNNNSDEDKLLNVSVGVTQGTQNNAIVSVTPNMTTIEPTKSQEFVVTFHIENTDKDASLDGFALNFNLKHSNQPITNIDSMPYLTYSLIDDTTASISYVDCDEADLVETIEVPSTLIVGAKSYTVTTIGGSFNLYNGNIVLPETITAVTANLGSKGFVAVKAVTPPTINYAATAGVKYLLVPEESIDAYKATSSQWNGTSYGMIDILPIGTIIVESDEYPFTCVLYKGELQYIRINTDSSLWSTFDGVIPENINLTIEGQTQSFAITKVIGKFTSSSVGFKPFVFSSFVTEINFTNTTGIYENITINATNPPKFTGTLPLRTGLFIYVPAESVTAYKTAEGWSDYAEYIVPIQ